MTETQSSQRMGAAEWGMLIALAAVWGGSFFFNEVAVRELPPFTVVVARVALAALVLLTVLHLRGQRLPKSRPVLTAFLGMGLLNNAIPFSLFVWGQQEIASGLAAILNATTPMFTVLVAHATTTDERLTPRRAAAVAIGFAGVAVMIGIDALAGLGESVTAQIACLAAAFSYGMASVFGRRFRRLGVAPMQTATGQVCASSLMMIPLMLAVDRPWTLPMPSIEAWGALIAVATVSTAFAYILYFRILARAGATNIALVTFLVPVSAVLLGVLILGETLAPRHIAGMAIIGAGLALLDGRILDRMGRRRPA